MVNSKTKKYPAVLDLIPVLLFFIFNKYEGIFVATGVLVISSIINFIASYVYTKSVNMTALVTVVLASFFGLLTILLNDENFIKIKVTIVNLFFVLVLLSGLFFKKNFLKLLLPQIKIKEQAWNKLTIYWIAFFLVLALLNEFVRHNFSTDMWVNFKVFGILFLTIIFTIIQFFLIRKYIIQEDK